MYDEDGLCIFAFEGKGNNAGVSSEKEIYPKGRYGAMIVVANKDKIDELLELTMK